MSRLRLNCPYGGSFFVCEHNTTEFIGCCTIDPRQDGRGICPEENLRNASFSPSGFAEIMPQSCGDDSSSWYTCNFTSPPFLGCCKTNPCDGPCAPGDLAPAKLSNDGVARGAFLPATQPNASLPLPTPPESSGVLSTAPPEGSGELSTPAIAGFAIAAAAVVVLIAWCMFTWGRRSGKRAKTRPELLETEHNHGDGAPAQRADALHIDVPTMLVSGRRDGVTERAFATHRELPVTGRTGTFQHSPIYEHSSLDFAPAPVQRADVLHSDIPPVLIPGLNHLTSTTGTASTHQGWHPQRRDSLPHGQIYELSTPESGISRDPDELHLRSF